MQQQRGVAAPRKPLALGNIVPSLLKGLAGTHSLDAILMSTQQDLSPGTKDCLQCSHPGQAHSTPRHPCGFPPPLLLCTTSAVISEISRALQGWVFKLVVLPDILGEFGSRVST